MNGYECRRLFKCKIVNHRVNRVSWSIPHTVERFYDLESEMFWSGIPKGIYNLDGVWGLNKSRSCLSLPFSIPQSKW
ncbi:hypothetical protein VNO77_01497 [Canavalia gladiata]|uniref:Uncharacterized protein n=1 Tax=Canavalia gladiata TaxID=3824 RepID=A0AAN9MRZ7_CANGL